MEQWIIFVPHGATGTQDFFRAWHAGSGSSEKAEACGIVIRSLTPRILKTGGMFSVRTRGKYYKGYVTGHGDFVVHLKKGEAV